MKEHQKTLALSQDTADLCAAAAKICTRKGPMTAAVCDACLRACRACGAECGKYPDMAPMAACAKSCATCGAACKQILDAKKRGGG
jgi:hypothetical protein